MTTAERARDAWLAARDPSRATETTAPTASSPPTASVDRARRATNVQNHHHQSTSHHHSRRPTRARDVVDDFVRRALASTFDVDAATAWWTALDAASETATGFGVAAAAAFARARRKTSWTDRRVDVVDDGGDEETREEEEEEDETMRDADACARAEVDDAAFASRAAAALAALASGDVGDATRRDVADVSRGLSECWCRGRAGGVTYEACRDALVASRTYARDGVETSGAATPQDACLLRVMCRAKAYDDVDASGLLDETRALKIDAEATCLDATDFLLSRYYGGRAHLARKRYAAAARWFRDAVTAPANALSAIAAASLKKYVLARALSVKTSLADFSRMDFLPPYTSSPVTRYAASRDFDAYAEMRAALAMCSVDEYERVAETHAETYAADGNAGLVDLLRERVLAERVRGLAETYSTLSLEDAARILRVPSARDAETLVRRATVGGYVDAVIDGVDGIVRFLEESVDAPSDADVVDALRRRLEAAHALDARVREENARFAKSRKYVTHEVNETRKTAAAQTRMESQS